MEETALELSAGIVAAFLRNHVVTPAELPSLIATVNKSLATATSGDVASEVEAAPRAAPAVPIKKSVTPEQIFCLEDGKGFKSLKRHLRTAHGLDPTAYRLKWGLKKDYPITASGYSERRSDLAKSIGLGQGGKRPSGIRKMASKRASKPNAEDAK